MWKEGKLEDLIDSSIMDTCSLPQVYLCIHVALLCVQENPDDRPFMPYIVSALDNGTTNLPPPNRPAYLGLGNTKSDQNRCDIENSKNIVTLTIIEGR
jgi:hypothetical protein